MKLVNRTGRSKFRSIFTDVYENSTYNKNNISSKWEKDELFNRFVGEMANHLQKNLGPQCTP